METYPKKRYIDHPGLKGGSEIGVYLMQGNIRHLAFGALLILGMICGFWFAARALSNGRNETSDCTTNRRYDFYFLGVILKLTVCCGGGFLL
eukprot:g28148.t1